MIHEDSRTDSYNCLSCAFCTSRYNKWVSLFAAVMCIVLMFAMEWIYALITVCFLGVLAIYILWR